MVENGRKWSKKSSPRLFGRKWPKMAGNGRKKVHRGYLVGNGLRALYTPFTNYLPLSYNSYSKGSPLFVSTHTILQMNYTFFKLIIQFPTQSLLNPNSIIPQSLFHNNSLFNQTNGLQRVSTFLCYRILSIFRKDNSLKNERNFCSFICGL